MKLIFDFCEYIRTKLMPRSPIYVDFYETTIQPCKRQIVSDDDCVKIEWILYRDNVRYTCKTEIRFNHGLTKDQLEEQLKVIPIQFLQGMISDSSGTSGDEIP